MSTRFGLPDLTLALQGRASAPRGASQGENLHQEHEGGQTEQVTTGGRGGVLLVPAQVPVLLGHGGD